MIKWTRLDKSDGHQCEGFQDNGLCTNPAEWECVCSLPGPSAFYCDQCKGIMCRPLFPFNQNGGTKV